MVPYLLIADLQNTVLSAILVFSDRVLYPSYSTAPRLFRFSALEDQIAAGAIMWVMGSLAFIVPAVVIAVQCLSSKAAQPLPVSLRRHHPSLDDGVLPGKIPFATRFLRARWSGKAAEATIFAILFAMAGLTFAGLLAPGSGDDDSQVLRLQDSSGTFAVAVFAPAGDLGAGRSPFNVLAQDRNTREVLLDTTIDVTAHAAGEPQRTAERRAPVMPTRKTAAANRGAGFPAAGDWNLNFAVRQGSAVADFPCSFMSQRPGTNPNFPGDIFLCL